MIQQGSPGVGKTSLISAMAKLSGQKLVRINLSEQTDMMDLLGSDMPAHGNSLSTCTSSQYVDRVFICASDAVA